MQEALLAAALQWPERGVPDSPRGLAGHGRLPPADRHLRSRRAAPAPRGDGRGCWTGASVPAADAAPADRDDTLLLLFLCCHPALTPASAIALTLRAVGGLTTAEIAAAFLVPEATMAQRISRAKQRIQASGMPFQHAGRADLAGAPGVGPARALPDLQRGLTPVPTATTCSGPTCRGRRSGSPAPCTRLLPDEPEVAGLLALMLLTDARGAARTGPHGELIPLDRAGPQPVGPRAIVEGVALRQRRAPAGRGRPVPAAGGDRRRPRRGADGRGNRLAADPGPVRGARAHPGQPHGDAEPGGRRWPWCTVPRPG